MDNLGYKEEGEGGGGVNDDDDDGNASYKTSKTIILFARWFCIVMK